MSMSTDQNWFPSLSPKQKRWLLLSFPLLVVLVVMFLWPAQPCEKVVVKFEKMKAAIEQHGFIAVLDTFAYGGHCDTFSLVNDKSFWIVPKCGRSGAQFRDSLQVEGRTAAIRELTTKSKMGAVHYHYPTVSFESNQKFRGGYDFRLVYSRKKLKEQHAFWTSCDVANETKKRNYYIYLNEHWYIAARKLRS
jgi:hypothetical protein